MKDLIKNILLEQTEMVPPESWPGESRDNNPEEFKWNKQSITKAMFFKGVKLLAKHNDKTDLKNIIYSQRNMWDRSDEVYKYVKLVGVRSGSEGLTSKMLWAAYDNYSYLVGEDEIIAGKYDELDLRPLLNYDVSMFEDSNEYKTTHYTVKIEAFDEVDATNDVTHDEDGVYQQYDWPDNQDVETHEYEIQDRGVLEVRKADSKNITESKLKAGPEENDIISELEELLGNKELTEKKVKSIIRKYKSKPLTEQVLKEQTVSSEAEEAARFNQQPITIVEAKFMTRVKLKFDTTVIAKWAAMTHYDVVEQQELTQIARPFGVSSSGRYNNALRLTQLINLIWDNMDLEDFSSLVGEQAPKLQFIEITKHYQEVTDSTYRATASSWGINYETNACDMKDNFWNYDPDLEHQQDDSHDVVQGSEQWVMVTVDGNVVWDDVTKELPVDNEYSPDKLTC